MAASYDGNDGRRRRAPATIGLSASSVAGGRMPSGGNTIGSKATMRRNSDGSRCAAISKQAPPIEWPNASIGPPVRSTSQCAIAVASSP